MSLETNRGGTADTEPRLTEHKFCSGCGKELHKSALSCPACGAVQHSASQKSKLAAALLALFLGGFGIHHFYLGNVLLGIIYLVFCWTFIPAIIAFIEAIIYLVMSEERFQEKYPPKVDQPG